MSLGLQRPIWAMTIDIPDNEQLIGLWPPCCYHIYTAALCGKISDIVFGRSIMYPVFKVLKEIMVAYATLLIMELKHAHETF